MSCNKCLELYEVNKKDYYGYFCKLWKKWLLKDNQDNPVCCKDCEETK